MTLREKFSQLLPILAFVAWGLIASAPTMADWQADTNDKKQAAAQSAISQLKERIPRSRPYFDDAYGFAILPSITRLAFGFGGAYGSGIVVKGETLIGETGFWQFTSGIQAGVRSFSMIVFFKDKEALESFKTRKLQFMGQSGLTFATIGIAGTPAYDDGVAIFTVTRLGLMGEFSISGAKFTYKPL